MQYLQSYSGKNIPTYHLTNFSTHEGETLDILFLNRKLENSPARIDISYRSDYYQIGICLQGKAELKANLKTYTIEPDCLVALSPHVIKQLTFMSEDFQILSLFFTNDFITTNNNLHLDKFHFFDSVASTVFKHQPHNQKILLHRLS